MKNKPIYCKHCGTFMGTSEKVGKRRVCQNCKRAQWRAAFRRYVKKHGRQDGYKVLNKKYKAALLEVEKLKKSKNGSHKKYKNIRAYLLKCKKAFISLFRALLNR